MRVTDQLKQKRTQRNLSKQAQNHQSALGQASDGKRVRQASDDPVAYHNAKRMRQEELRHDAYKSNGERMDPLFAQADESLGQAADILTRVKELSVMASNDLLSQTQRGAIKEEILGLRDALHQVANTKYQGAHVFSGTASDTQAYDPTGAYTGSTDSQRVSVGPSATVGSIRGDEVFTVSGPAGAESVFEALDRFAGQIDVGDVAGIAQSQDLVDEAIEGVLGGQQRAGAAQNLIEQAGKFSEAIGFGAVQEQGRLTDADFAKTISDLQSTKTTYEASLRLEQEMRTMTDLVLRF